jgi:hypothetical protein
LNELFSKMIPSSYPPHGFEFRKDGKVRILPETLWPDHCNCLWII